MAVNKVFVKTFDNKLANLEDSIALQRSKGDTSSNDNIIEMVDKKLESLEDALTAENYHKVPTTPSDSGDEASRGFNKKKPSVKKESVQGYCADPDCLLCVQVLKTDQTKEELAEELGLTLEVYLYL